MFYLFAIFLFSLWRK